MIASTSITNRKGEYLLFLTLLIVGALMAFSTVQAAFANEPAAQIREQSIAAAQSDDVISSGSCGPNARYELARGGILTIEGSGPITSNPWSSSGCSKVTIGNGITSICGDAFNVGNRNLAEVVIADSVTAIGDRAFKYSPHLTSVKLSANLKTLGKEVFCDCYSLKELNLPAKLQQIGEACFQNCALVGVHIPRNLARIPKNAFADCTSLGSVVITGNTTIDEYAFYHSGVTSVATEGDARVGGIGQYAFERCSRLESVSVSGAKDAVIGKYAFKDCNSLTQIVVKSGFSSIDSEAFSLDRELSSVDLGGSSISEIGYGAFSSCSSLTSAALPSSLRTIGVKAFSGCVSLQSLALPKSIRAIKDGAFYKCTSNPFGVRLVIPASVTELGGGVFEGIEGIRTVEFMGDNPNPYLQYDPFYFKADVIIQHNKKWSNRSFVNSSLAGGDLTWYRREANGKLTKLPYISTLEETRLSANKPSSTWMSKGESHCYSITLSSARTVNLSMIAIGDTGCVHWMYLYAVKDPKGNTIAAGMINYQNEKRIISRKVKLPAGTSYVEVKYLDSHKKSAAYCP